MNPAFLDEMSWEMAEVYGAISDQILINLAHYFPFFHDTNLPRSAFTYQAKMLAQMGQVTNQTARIIRHNLSGADDALERILEQAIIDSVRSTEPELLKATLKGFITPPGMPITVSPQQMRAFKLYYQQAADKLNLVNTVMLESTQSAYAQAVSDVVAEIDLADRLNRTQIALDTAAGETVTGVSSWNQALQHATDRLKEGGITGFIDHAGRRWSAESYVAMDIRTTVANTARSAVWETNQNFGNDLYQVSSHDGARPLCYPWQGKVVSSIDATREVEDLDGNKIHVYAQSETTYGQAAGLFGINCKHYPTPFIPGVSTIRAEPQDEEDNARTYEESQKQRALERRLREEKRDLEFMKAQGASDDQIRAQRERVRSASNDIDEFCNETGRARRRNREGVYTQREYPAADKYDVAEFEHAQQDKIRQYYKNGGEQQGYTFGQMNPEYPTPQNVAPQVTQPAGDVVQSQAETFKPAKTRAEAEEYAREHFANTVVYNGSISVDTMNTINKELKDLTDEYPIDKLRYIKQNGRMSALARASGGTLEVNGKSIHLESDSYAMRQEYARKRLERIKAAYPDGIPKLYASDVKKYEEILKYSRWTIDDEMESALKVRATIAHEYGHILADQHCGQINKGLFCKGYNDPATVAKRKLIDDTFKKAKETGDIYKLSEYGGTNSHEFFAETFSALWTNQPLPDYFIEMIRGVV